MKALVTGGAGFIGSHLTERLIARGHQVVVLDSLVSGRLENLETIADNPNCELRQRDIEDMDSCLPSFAGVDWVFHLAGIADIVPSIENPERYFRTNVKGTLNVLECARRAGARRFIYAASSSSYGIPDVYPTPETTPISPRYPYALTKHIGEELVHHWGEVYNLPAVSLRLFNVYGPRSRTTGTYGAVFGVFLAQKRNGKPLTVVGDGTQTRDFTYVTDVVDAFIRAAKADIRGESINIGSGNHYSVNQLTRLIGGNVVHIPKRPGEPERTFACIKKARDLLGWKPRISFEHGVRLMLKRIDDWQDAAIWEPESIEQATASWFKYLGKDSPAASANITPAVNRQTKVPWKPSAEV